MSDQDRLISWIRSGQTDEAIKKLEALCPLYLDMTTVLLEWSLAFAEVVRERFGDKAETELTSQVYAKWKNIIELESESSEQQEAKLLLLKHLQPTPIKTHADRMPTAEAINAIPLQTWTESFGQLKGGQLEQSIELFERFVCQSRARHDFLCQYLWVYPSVLNEVHGQKNSEDLMLKSFQSCTMYKSFLAILRRLPPEGIVAFVAEHLRGHFSGPDRRGSVEIIEEPDRYRLIFDACGSGGAMRRKAAKRPASGLENYPEATPATWGLAAKVPSFCAHCAQNEIVMIEELGYPGWVVEFDPDPVKPCGWTVFKDLSQVPEKYYERVGMKKDKARVKNPPKAPL